MNILYGAIIGDIIGSPYEGDEHTVKTKNFKIFKRGSHFTDDTVMTIAVADALLACEGFDESSIKAAVTKSMQRWGCDYPHAGYGHRFKGWLRAYDPQPYKSSGNGAAMRVAGVALLGKLYGDLNTVRDVARWTAEVTHNHPEGVKGAESVASAIFLAQAGKSKDEIKSYVEKNFGYDLSRTLDEIRPAYHHETAAAKSVPETIIAFLESENFEDAIRNAVSLGGDSDTLAAITGSIAAAFYDIPDDFKELARKKITLEMLDVLGEVNRIVAMQEKCAELHGNRIIDVALRKFRADTWFDTESELLGAIRQRIQDKDSCVLIAMEKISEDDDAENFRPLTFQADYPYWVVFTNAWELFKLFREAGHSFKVTTSNLPSLMQNCADIKAGGVPIGIAINPYSNQQYTLTPQKINDLLTGDGLTEKAQMYKQLVEKAKTRYPEYHDGLATGNGVELFAPVVDGKNICDEINLYTYWQGFGYAKKTPKIKYLLVAQDWGNFIDADKKFISAIEKMNAGEDVFYPFSMKSPIDKNLIELFKVLKRDISKPCTDVFFTNFCLGYRSGKAAGGMTNELMMRDADLFKELCEILEPENILCLGQITSECVYEALTGEPFKKIYGGAKNYNDFLNSHKCINVTCGKKVSQIYPLAHCGHFGLISRPLDVQIKDWKRIAREQFEKIFPNALYIIFNYPSSYPDLSYLDAKGTRHNVNLDKCLEKIFSRLPDMQNRETDDWRFFYSGMGFYFIVNKKVLNAYMKKTGINEQSTEIGFDSNAALETVTELNRGL